MTARWKQVLAKPAGALPPNVVQKLAVFLVAVMILALMLTQLGGGPEEDEFVVDAGEAEAVDEGYFGQLMSRLGRDMEQVAMDQERRAAEAAAVSEEEAAEAAIAELAARAGTVPDGMVPTVDNAAGGAGAGEDLPLTQGEAELREMLRLEALERRTRSLRTPSLVQSFRSPEDRSEPATNEEQPAEAAAAVGQEAGTPDVPPLPTPALPDTAALFAQQPVMDPALLTSLGGGAPNSTRRPPIERTVPGVTGPPVEETAEPARVTSPADPEGYERVYEGSVLSAVLVTQLSGEFAGPVLAQVAIPFYSKDRQRVLVPRGTRLLGTAQPVEDQDQSRLAVGFHRMVWPDGRWVDLSFHGLNQIGESALIDQVNRHYWSMFAAAGAVGVLAGLTLQGSNPYAGGLEGFRASAGQGFGQSATQILQRFLNRMPTITIRAGHRMRVWVTSDFLVPRPEPHPERMFR